MKLDSEGEMSADVEVTLGAFANSLLKPGVNNPSVSQMVRAVGSKVDVQHAVEKIEKKKASRRRGCACEITDREGAKLSAIQRSIP